MRGFTDIENDAASTTACQCPPRSATRLSHTQPEASCVMAVEFFFTEHSRINWHWRHLSEIRFLYSTKVCNREQAF